MRDAIGERLVRKILIDYGVFRKITYDEEDVASARQTYLDMSDTHQCWFDRTSRAPTPHITQHTNLYQSGGVQPNFRAACDSVEFYVAIKAVEAPAEWNRH